MKITIVTGPWLPVPPLRGGAMQKSWFALSREFVRAGHEVKIVARRFGSQPAEESVEGLRIVRPWGFRQSGLLGWDLVKDWLYAWNVLLRLPRADILVTNDFWLPALAAGLRSSAGSVVVSAGRFPKGQYRLYRRVARIVAISGAVKAALVAEQPVLSGRTVVIPLPVDLDRLAGPGGPRPEWKTLLYVGRIHPEKGIELLIRSFSAIAGRFPGWRLQLVGPIAEGEGGGGAPFASRLKEIARGLPVEWTPAEFDPQLLAGIYRAADLFCYPSLAERGEAFGVAALEAMAAGVPAVVSDLACFRDFLRDGENGWVFDHREPGAVDRLASILDIAMADNSLRQRRAVAARADAEGFSFGAIARRYLDEFERIARERTEQR